MKRKISLCIGLLLGLMGAAQGELLAGAEQTSIVPPFPTQMGGFFDRLETFTGVHDDLRVHALALESGDTRLILIGSDLMALDDVLTGQVRQSIEKATGIPGTHVLVSCVHTHSAPAYYRLMQPGIDERLRDFLVERFTETAIRAFNNRVPAALGFRAGEIQGATRNRQQNNETVLDTQAGVWRIEALPDHKTIATLFNFTGHPVIVGSENLLLSGEWPGAACRVVEQVFGGVPLFFQGALGDVTVHRQGDPFSEVERVGRLVAGETIKTASFIRPAEDAPIAIASRTLAIPPRPLPTPQEAQAALEEQRTAMRQAQSRNASQETLRAIEQRVEFWDALLQQARAVEAGTVTRPETYAVEVQVVRLGEALLVGIPGELFVEYALELRARVAQRFGLHTCIAGFSNGYLGYFVTPRAMATGGYEASTARLGTGAGREMIETAMQLAEEILP